MDERAEHRVRQGDHAAVRRQGRRRPAAGVEARCRAGERAVPDPDEGCLLRAVGARVCEAGRGGEGALRAWKGALRGDDEC